MSSGAIASSGPRRALTRAVNRLPAVYRNVAGTIGASLAVQLALLVNGVATARLLGVLGRGHLALLILLSTVLPIIATLGLPLGLTYWIARTPQQARDLLRLSRPIIVYQLLALLAVHAVVLYVLFRDSPGYVQAAAAISLLSSPATALWGFGMAILQGNQQFRALNLSRMISPPINAAVMAALLFAGVHSLVLASMTWTALIWLTAIVTGVAAIRGLSARADARSEAIPSRRTLIGFSLKALLGSVTPLEGFQLDQAIVGIFISPFALGLYVVAVAFTNLTRFIAQAIGLVAYPHVAAGSEARGAGWAILRFLGLTLALCGITVIVLELALPFLVPHLFGSGFRAAIGVARILLISALLFALRRVLSECARGAGRPSLGSVAEAVSLVTLFPAVVLLYHHGARGVALALVVASAAGLIAIIIGLLGSSRSRHQLFVPAPSGRAVGFEPAGALGFEPPGAVGFEPAGAVGFEPAGAVGFEPPAAALEVSGSEVRPA